MSTASQVFRKGKRILKVPLNGQQRFELKNNGCKSRYIEVSFHSSRLSILESRRITFDKFEFSVSLKPKSSLIFTVADRGRVEETEDFSVSYEGLLRIMVKTGECVEGKPPNGSSLYLSDMVFTLDPETDSYRTFCEIKDYNAEMILEHIPSNHPMNKIISIEPLPEGKHEKTIPENIAILKLTRTDREDNKRIEKKIADKVKIVMEKRRKEAEMKPPKLENLGQGWRTLGNKKSIPNSAESEKKNESVNEKNPTSKPTKSQKMYKSLEQSLKPIDPEVLEKLEDMLDKLAEDDQKDQENKEEQLETSLTENPKSTLKSEKTSKSEMVQESGKVDLSELKNEEKKKKKKKCVIS